MRANTLRDEPLGVVAEHSASPLRPPARLARFDHDANAGGLTR